MIYVNIVFVILFFLAWNENDFITHQPKYCFFPKWEWYTENRWQTKSWWLKNVFTFLLDGMHFTSSIYRFLGYFFFSQLIYQGWKVFALSIALYVFTGFLHSVMNQTMFSRR